MVLSELKMNVLLFILYVFMLNVNQNTVAVSSEIRVCKAFAGFFQQHWNCHYKLRKLIFNKINVQFS